VTQRRHHYERAFEDYLRERRIPYVAVDEAKKALLPEPLQNSPRVFAPPGAPGAIKSFDFVIYGQRSNLLVEVKGRRIREVARAHEGRVVPRPRLDSWVTREDVESLGIWERLFGEGFGAAFVFVYWCDEQPPDALFAEVFESRGRWYAVRMVSRPAYAAAMRTRSPKWGTVHVKPAEFEKISRALTERWEPNSLEPNAPPGRMGR
jgi:hypothetical protein